MDICEPNPTTRLWLYISLGCDNRTSLLKSFLGKQAWQGQGGMASLVAFKGGDRSAPVCRFMMLSRVRSVWWLTLCVLNVKQVKRWRGYAPIISSLFHNSMPHFYAQPFNRLATERNSHDGNVPRQYSFYLRHLSVYPPYWDCTPFKSRFFVFFLACVLFVFVKPETFYGHVFVT